MVLVVVYSPCRMRVLQEPQTPARQAAMTGTLCCSNANSSEVPTGTFTLLSGWLMVIVNSLQVSISLSAVRNCSFWK